MLQNIKILIVIIAFALAAFYICKPVCLQYMSDADFKRRRNVWLALTIVAFLSPAFWIYAICALLILGWAASRDENPLALYMLVTFTVPNVSFYVPLPFVNQLFDITQYRLLSLAILIPAMFRLQSSEVQRGLRLPDVLLLGFLLLQVVLLVPYESVTNTMRRTFLFGIDVFIVFYVFSRLPTRQRIADVMACFYTAGVVMAPVAIFESAKGWLLYVGLNERWGDPNAFAWLFRGGSLRAQAATMHSINLGYQLALGLGFYLYIRYRSSSLNRDWSAIALLSLGIAASYSRGSWITAVIVVLLFAAIRPDGKRHFAQALVVGCALVAFIYVTPMKETIIDRLPFIGKSDQSTVDYREQLFEVSINLIKQNPVFGDPLVYSRMESLRQGQGIIDIVNGYVYAALFTGLFGLSLLVGTFLASLWRCWHALVKWQGDREGALMGASLVSCMVGTLAFIASAGYGPTTYALCGLLVSFGVCYDSERIRNNVRAHGQSAMPSEPQPLNM